MQSAATKSNPPDAREDDELFLRSVRRFFEEQLTPDLRAAGRATTGVHTSIEACREWHRRLFARGWIAPAWPKAHGGTGWTANQRFLFERECADNDAPVLFAGGIRSLGPLLIAMGSETQKRRYLPAILNGDDLWCQGFSETEAGSDLAALSTQAIREGDVYRVGGSKIWTTGAQYCNRMFALVRTSRGPRPTDGITFLLIDTDAPGLAISPIRTMDGEHEFNRVVFDDVRVPVANCVGEENQGWSAAKLLMRFARGNNTTAAHLRRSLRRVKEISTKIDDSIRLAEIETSLAAYEALEFTLLSANRLNGSDEIASSMLKTLATELNQRISELGLECAGYAGFIDMQLCGKRYVATRAASIYSGTNEIHRNLMARHLIAL
jgi:acyl-CoA dehydrogenase